MNNVRVGVEVLDGLFEAFSWRLARLTSEVRAGHGLFGIMRPAP